MHATIDLACAVICAKLSHAASPSNMAFRAKVRRDRDQLFDHGLQQVTLWSFHPFYEHVEHVSLASPAEPRVVGRLTSHMAL
jgi:hypothetical protein